MKTPQERFWAKVSIGEPSECWLWSAYVEPETGYGQFWDGTRLVKAHRFAYGVVPEGRVVDHDCHNQSTCSDVPCLHRRCCNPAHLVATTQSENSINGRSGDHQSSKTHCPQGHEYSPENTLLRRNGRHRICRLCNRVHQAKYNRKRATV